MLTCTRLSNDACLAHVACNENLSNGVVDFVSPCVVQVLTLQIDLAAIMLAQPFGEVERRRSSYIISKQLPEFLLETFRFHHFQIGLLQVLHTFVKYLRNVSSSELSIITFVVN